MTVQVQAVIFDLDGTLLDHGGAVASALTQWLPAFGIEPTNALIGAWFDAEERHLPAWHARQISLAEQRRRRLQDFVPRPRPRFRKTVLAASLPT